jgi:hypothetical protein
LPVARFVLHTLVGVALFSLIGGAAVLLHYLIGAIEYSRVSISVVRTLQLMELFLFASDMTCFAVFMMKETLTFIRGVLRPAAGGSHGQTVR